MNTRRRGGGIAVGWRGNRKRVMGQSGRERKAFVEETVLINIGRVDMGIVKRDCQVMTVMKSVDIGVYIIVGQELMVVSKRYY